MKITAYCLLLMLLSARPASSASTSGKTEWTKLCKALHRQHQELKKRYQELTPEAQTEANQLMDPPEMWIRFDCRENWRTFGKKCAEAKIGIAICVYRKVLERVRN